MEIPIKPEVLEQLKDRYKVIEHVLNCLQLEMKALIQNTHEGVDMGKKDYQLDLERGILRVADPKPEQ